MRARGESECGDSTVLEDEWSTIDLSRAEHYSSACSIERIPINAITREQFDAIYRFARPVILVDDVGRNADFRSLTARRALLRSHGALAVKVASSNTYSYDKKTSCVISV